MPPHTSGTIRFSPLQYGFPPAPLVFRPLPPPPSALLTVARASKRDMALRIKPKLSTRLSPLPTLQPHSIMLQLYQPLCCPLTHQTHSCLRISALALPSARKALPPDVSQGWHFCVMPVSASVSPPQGSSPPTPVTQPPTASATLQVCLSRHSAFMTPEDYSSPPQTVLLICLLLYHLCTSTWTQTPREWAFSGSDTSI